VGESEPTEIAGVGGGATKGLWMMIITYDHLFDYEHALFTFKEPMQKLFLTEQMSLKNLKQFGKDSTDVVVNELQQLD
jgi:hypothetical protein